MPILGGLMAALFTALFDFFVVYFTRTVAIKLAFAALITSAFGLLLVSMEALVAGISYSLPSGLLAVFQFVFPSNVVPCMAAVIACDSVVAGFRLFASGTRV